MATLTARMDALETLVAAMPRAIVEAVIASQASAPVPAAPAVGAPATPKAGFPAFLAERAASRKACAVHAGCTRMFTPASTGAASHVACTGCAERKHHHAA